MLERAQVIGKGVGIDAAELNIESLQDTAKYDSKQKDMSAQVTVGYGFSASGSYSQSKMSSDYAAVTEQSGIMAGDDGYQINVKGNTDLKGAIITSTQAAEDAGKNKLSTDSLTYSDIQNHADYEGESFGIGGSAAIHGGADGKTVDKNGQATSTVSPGIGYGSDDGHDSSTTASGINTSNITITDEAKQQQLTGKTTAETIADIHTNVTTDNYADNAGSLKNNFDKDAVQKELDLQREVTQAFDQNVQAAKAKINSKIDDLKKQRDEGKLTQAQYEEQVQNLQYLSLGLSTVAAGLSAPTDSVDGIIAATVALAVTYEIGQHFKEQGTEGSAAHILAHAVLGAAVAAAGGNDALTAAIASGGAEAAAPILTDWLYGTSETDKLTAEQRSTLSAITNLLGATVGATTGDVGSIVSGRQVAQSAVDNNWGDVNWENRQKQQKLLDQLTQYKNNGDVAAVDKLLKEHPELLRETPEY